MRVSILVALLLAALVAGALFCVARLAEPSQLPFDAVAWQSVTSSLDPGLVRYRMSANVFRKAVDERWEWERVRKELGTPNFEDPPDEVGSGFGPRRDGSWPEVVYHFVYPGHWSLGRRFAPVGFMRFGFGTDGRVLEERSVMATIS